MVVLSVWGAVRERAFGAVPSRTWSRWTAISEASSVPVLTEVLSGGNEPSRHGGFVEAVRRWAAGREMIHVSAYGTLDPCPFVPFSRFHVSDHGLLDVLCSEY
ncbi:MAG: hypothetical protein HYY06_18385, partial [Deltaproteobacteria bacterium]|nr:hypothetical protein [Deltaproteobacteria bacterium]